MENSPSIIGNHVKTSTVLTFDESMYFEKGLFHEIENFGIGSCIDGCWRDVRIRSEPVC
jgi:hypothetical protein